MASRSAGTRSRSTRRIEDGGSSGWSAVVVARPVRRVHGRARGRGGGGRRCGSDRRGPNRARHHRPPEAPGPVGASGGARSQDRRLRGERPQRVVRHDGDRPRVRHDSAAAGQGLLAPGPRLHGALRGRTGALYRRGPARLRQDPPRLPPGGDGTELRQAAAEAGRVDEVPRLRRDRLDRCRRHPEDGRLRALPGRDVGAAPLAHRPGAARARGEASGDRARGPGLRAQPGPRHRCPRRVRGQRGRLPARNPGRGGERGEARLPPTRIRTFSASWRTSRPPPSHT